MCTLQTVALSNVAIFAGAITNMVFNVPRKNPVRPGPVIDYDFLLLVRAWQLMIWGLQASKASASDLGPANAC